jgi:hypothetical protein
VFQPDGRPRVLIALVVFALLLIAALGKSDVTTRENSGRALQLFWMLPNSFWQHTVVMHGLAFAGTVGTFLLVVLLLKPGARPGGIRDLPFGWLLAGSIGASLFALHLVYVQLNDTYLVGLLPFALLIPARALATHGRPPRSLVPVRRCRSRCWWRCRSGCAATTTGRKRNGAPPTACWRPATPRLHRREPALERVPRRFRRVAGADLPPLRPHPRQGLAGNAGFSRRALLCLASQALLGRHAPGRRIGDVRAGERLASGSDRAVPQRTLQSPRRRRLRTHRCASGGHRLQIGALSVQGELSCAGRTTSAPR